MRVRYSRARFDARNTGSADATMENLEYWGIEDPALVFPTDSQFEFSLCELVAAHERAGALLTVATMDKAASAVIGRYGVMVTGSGGEGDAVPGEATPRDLRRAFPPQPDETASLCLTEVSLPFLWIG